MLKINQIKTSASEERFERVKQEHLAALRMHSVQAEYVALPEGGGAIRLAYRPLKQLPDEERKAMGGTLEEFVADVLPSSDRPQYTRAEQLEGAIKELSVGIERLEAKIQQTTDREEQEEMLERIEKFKKRLDEVRAEKKQP